MRRRATIGGVGLAMLLVVAPSADAASHRRAPTPRIEVLSNRADLISGGDALVAVDFPPSTSARSHHRRHSARRHRRSAAFTAAAHPTGVRMLLGRRNVTREFAWRANGRYEGLLTGLADGRNVLTAKLPDGATGRAVIVNHPIGGPVLSGPQVQPWVCANGSKDPQCNAPPTFKYEYMSTDPTKSGFQPYDPANPPTDVAQTTTDQGVTVPFVIRVETGYMDRDQYQISTLYQPGKPWEPWAPQPQFDHKLLILHGAGCGPSYESATAPATTGDSAGDYALGKGFMTMSTALDNAGHFCNVAVQAESLMMAKEHIVETYGTLRYTIGTGCSGGSLAQYWIANAYPGIYQGILPTCSFPDAWSSATQVADYALLERYFLSPQLWGPGVVWSPTQYAAVEGNALPVDAFVSVGCVIPTPPYTSSTCPTGYFYAAIPTWPCPGPTAQQRYDPNTNPGGVRCSIAEIAKNLLGPRPSSVWSAAEKKIGHGFAGLPLDNVGVQYGLQALQAGEITPAQFVDLNAHIGGADIDINPVPNRLVADQPALANAYRTGLINETNNLNQTAIIDCRGPDPGAAHDAYRAFAVRARLDREHGTHANQLIWEGPEPIEADSQCERNSFIAMDRWLAAVEKDTSSTPLATKVIRDKPADLGDECWDGLGQKVSDGLCPPGVVPVYGTARMVAGQPITTDSNKCQLVPLNRNANYGLIPFTDAQWAELQQAFPDGVCDFSKPGVSQQRTIPWQTYQDSRGRVIYGGRPLGAAPANSGEGWSSPAFSGWLERG